MIFRAEIQLVLILLCVKPVCDSRCQCEHVQPVSIMMVELRLPSTLLDCVGAERKKNPKTPKNIKVSLFTEKNTFLPQLDQ